jgi:hypothetical protein
MPSRKLSKAALMVYVGVEIPDGEGVEARAANCEPTGWMTKSKHGNPNKDQKSGRCNFKRWPVSRQRS